MNDMGQQRDVSDGDLVRLLFGTCVLDGLSRGRLAFIQSLMSAVAAERRVQPRIFMVALCNRADHYIFMLWFVLLSSSSSSFFFSSPNLSGRRLDVYHTLAHGVALVRI